MSAQISIFMASTRIAVKQTDATSHFFSDTGDNLVPILVGVLVPIVIIIIIIVVIVLVIKYRKNKSPIVKETEVAHEMDYHNPTYDDVK